MSEAIHARLARLHAELAEAYRDLDRSAAPQPGATHPATPRRALRVRDLAGLLQISERTVREMRARGELPPTIAIGSVVRWDARVIDEWMASRVEARR